MNPFESLIYALSGKMHIPVAYGAFHITGCAIVLAVSVAVCLIFGKSSEKTERRIILYCWILIVVLEIYKQFLYAIHFGDTVTWSYKWQVFPFQFCSSPLYLMPVAAFVKNRWIRDLARMFLATFSLFAGLIVLIVVGDVFSSYIGINIQTMVHHGVMVVIGFYLGGRLECEGKMTYKLFLPSCGVFGGLMQIALILNIAAPLFTDTLFNMFFIGPHYPCTLVVLGAIYPVVPYTVFLLIYLSGFSFAAFLCYLIQKYPRRLIKLISDKIREKQQNNTQKEAS